MAENKQRQKLVHLHTSEKKVPTKDILELGEIAVQHNDTEAALYIKKNNGGIAKFIDATAVDTKIKEEKDRAEGAEAALGTKISTLSGSSHTHANKEVLDGITKEKVDAWDAKANASHTHVIADVTNLQNVLDGKAASTHAHEIDDVTGLQAALDGKDSNGAAAQALKDAKDYADGLAGNYDAAGAAATVKSEVIGTSGDTKEKDTIKGAKKYADSAAATVKSDVIGTDGDDKDSLTIKGAKKYADILNTAMDGRVDALETSSHTHTNKDVLDDITEAKVTAWDAAKADAISSAKTYTDSAITALNLAETYAKKSVVKTLVGNDANKSARNIAAEEVAKVVADAPENFDTLKEIADWISSDTTGAASMANDINALKAISADTRLVKLEAISADTRLGTLEDKSHSHKNLDLLETYTQTNADLADAVTKKHTHSNKTVLDGITTEKVKAWDTAKADAISSAKTYTDSVASGKANTVHTHAITDVTGLQGALDGKAASAHTHAIADVTGLQGALDGKAASAHKHAIDDVTGLQAALDDKDSKGAASQALTDAKAYTDAQIKIIKIDCGTY